ncbi:restriction endonuclease subunit S [Tenacibaculum maritimum]|uniref:restriction endonuclease subunit S n=1 Tax=Tenacibaculum maritimum TaxID=107401 RepID=UPI00388EDC6E
MELTTKQGFKQTEVGLIPEDWEVVAFDKIFTYYSTSNYSKAQMSEVDEVGCIHYGLIHAIPNTQYDLNNGIKYYVTSEQAKYEYVRNGDVIMVDASEDLEGINKSVEVFGIGDKKYISGLHTYLLRDKKGLLADKFRGIVLNSQFVKNQMLQLAVGMKVFGVSKTQLAKVKILLPPTLKEQKAIATALSDVDDLIASLEDLIAKKQAIKQGAMQQLLKPSENWRKYKLGDTLDFVVDNRGKTPPIQVDGYPLVEVNAVYKQGKSLNLQKVTKFVSEKTYQNWFRDGHPQKGDILIVTVGSAGYTSYVKDSVFCVAQNLISLRFKPCYSSEFIFYLSKTDKFKRLVSSVLMGAVQPSLKVPHLNNFEFEFPDLESQSRIAKILSDMDTELEQLETKKAKYQQLKQGMLQELLTGNTRLV